jgi:hypothetical protein
LKVFISWSGEKAKDFAMGLKGWLPYVLQDLDPWVSAMDIDSGTLSMNAIHEQLSNISYGIIVTTAENQARPWINYEAGALWKSVDVPSNVVPILLDLEIDDLTSPLKNFQLRQLNKQKDRKPEFKALIESLNKARPNPVSQGILDESFENQWGKMEDIFERVESNTYAYEPTMSSTELRLEDIHQLVLKLDQSSRATLGGVEKLLEREDSSSGLTVTGHVVEDGSRAARFEKIINDSLIARGSSDRAFVRRIDKRNYEVYSAHRLPDEVKAAVEQVNAQVPYWIDFSYMLTYSEDGPDA